MTKVELKVTWDGEEYMLKHESDSNIALNELQRSIEKVALRMSQSLEYSDIERKKVMK